MSIDALVRQLTPNDKYVPIAEVVKKIDPLEQGALDNLCGVYAAINGLRLLRYSVRKMKFADTAHIFAVAIHRLHELQPYAQHISYGISTSVWHELLRDIAFFASGNGLAVSLQLFRDSKGENFQDWIKTSLENGMPVMTLIKGGYRHYSVVQHIDAGEVRLFDSWGYETLPSNRCFAKVNGLLSSQATARFVLYRDCQTQI